MAKPKSRIITVANRKGGVGKSTFTVLFASSISNQFKKKVIVLDLDVQQTVYTLWKGVSKPLFECERINVKDLKQKLNDIDGEYDYIFLDVPRITDITTQKSDPSINAIKYSDTVIVPVLGTVIDVLSTIPFYNLIKDIADLRKENNYPFKHKAFLNRSNSRKTNELAMQYLKGNGIKLMENQVNDYAIFQNVDPEIDVLETYEGRTRFKPFFDEICETFKIK